MTFPFPFCWAGDFAGLADLDLDLLPSAIAQKMRKNSLFNYSFTADTTKVKLFPVVGFLPEETERC